MSKYLNKQSLINGIKMIDIGGVPPTLNVQGNDNVYKSVKGGILSSLIIILSMAYSIYMLYQWYDGKILPKTISQKQSIDYEEFSFDYSPVSISFNQYNDPNNSQVINPFQEDQAIMIPVISTIVGSSLTNFQPLVPWVTGVGDMAVNLTNSQSQNVLFVHNQNGYKQKPPYINETQHMLNFYNCTPQLLQILNLNYTCANQTLRQNFIALKSKSIVVSIYFKEFQEDSLTFVNRTKAYYFLLDDSQSMYSQVVLRTKNMSILHGPLFQREIKNNFLDSVEIISQTVSFSESQKDYYFGSYATFLIRLDSVKYIEQLSYPTLGDVAASIGSIVSLIFCLKLLITLYNEDRFQKELVDVIVSSSSRDIPFIENKDLIKSNKKIAQEKINIFNLHKELANMRIELDQIMEKKYDDKQQNNHVLNIQPKKQYFSRDQKKEQIILNEQINLHEVCYYEADNRKKSMILKPIVKKNSEEILIKEPDKFYEIELPLHNQQNIIPSKLDIQKPKKNRIQQNSIAYLEQFQNIEHQQKYEIYQEDS